MIQKILGMGLLLLLLALWSGCQDEVAQQLETDQMLIEQYVADHDLEGEYTEEGIFISFLNEGIGVETPTLASRIETIYSGSLLDGTPFDDSDGFPVTIRLSRTIRGWQIALPRFKREARGTVVIPSQYGYGARGSGDIPPNAVLVFDIELMDF